MLRNGLLVAVIWSFFSSISFAVVESNNELSKRFSEAQRLATQGQVTQAITAYQALILSNPQLPEAYNNLAALYLQQNKTKQAKHILEQGLHAHKGYGVLYESLTAINVAMAREAYSKALQIELKPSTIRIASLSLSNGKSRTKQNTIIISEINKPVIEEKPAIEPKVIYKAKPVSEIKRVSMTRPKIQNTQSVEKVLQAWSSAWSAQAVDMYLSFYHNQYRPANGMSRKGWVQSRRYRLKKPRWIKIDLSDFKIKKQTSTQAVVNFKQFYQSNSFSDVSNKQVVLINTDDGWRIFREKSF